MTDWRVLEFRRYQYHATYRSWWNSDPRQLDFWPAGVR